VLMFGCCSGITQYRTSIMWVSGVDCVDSLGDDVCVIGHFR
jgi:hypothetical protein